MHHARLQWISTCSKQSGKPLKNLSWEFWKTCISERWPNTDQSDSKCMFLSSITSTHQRFTFRFTGIAYSLLKCRIQLDEYPFFEMDAYCIITIGYRPLLLKLRRKYYILRNTWHLSQTRNWLFEEIEIWQTLFYFQHFHHNIAPQYTQITQRAYHRINSRRRSLRCLLWINCMEIITFMNEYSTNMNVFNEWQPWPWQCYNAFKSFWYGLNSNDQSGLSNLSTHTVTRV